MNSYDWLRVETCDAVWYIVPKVASKTLQAVLKPVKDKRNKPVYTVVRNPRDRFASAMAFYQQRKRFRFNRSVPITEQTTPEEMISLVEGKHEDIHFLPQSFFVPRAAQALKLEGEDWKHLVGGDIPVRHSTDHPKAEDWFSPQVLARIDAHYREDFDLWERARG